MADEPNLAELIAEFEQALARRSWEQIRGLFDDHARIESVAAGGAAHGPDDTVAAMRAAAETGIYSLGEWKTELISPDAAVVYSRMRHRHVARGSITDEGLFWLMTRRGEGFWRVRIFRERDPAISCLDEHGLDLGL